MQRGIAGHDRAGAAHRQRGSDDGARHRRDRETTDLDRTHATTRMQMDAVTGDALTDAGQQVDAVRVVLPQGQSMHGQGCVMADDIGWPRARDGQHAQSVSLGRCG